MRTAARPTAAVIDMSAGFRESLDDLPDRAGFGVHFLHPQGEFLRSSALSEVDCRISDVVMPTVDGFGLRRPGRTAHLLDQGSRPRHRQHLLLRPRRPPSQRRTSYPRKLSSRCRDGGSYLIRTCAVVQTSPRLWLYVPPLGWDARTYALAGSGSDDVACQLRARLAELDLLMAVDGCPGIAELCAADTQGA